MLRRAALRSLVVCVLLIGSASGCRSGLTVSVVKSPEFNALPPARPDKIKLLDGTPDEPYVVVGFVQLRATRPRPLPTFISELISAADGLRADALIPPERKEDAEETTESHNPLRAYFVRDDDRGQIVEAYAIRFRYSVGLR